MVADRVFTVLELNDAVKGLIREVFPNYVWVCGEIQDLRERAHINFNLVQKDENKEQIAAQVKSVIFANVRPFIIKRIKQADAGFQLNNDIEVKLLCRVDLYSKTGQFSLTVFDIDPVYTLGKVAQNRLKIIEDLRKRGLFDKNKEKDMPLLPLRVGLITAYESAAYHDFINELKISNHGFKVTVIDSYMQGQYVENNVIAALNYFNKFDRRRLDVVVITRGGGSTADLSFFDNKRIAETIAGMKFPVIAALGHQINVTIVDMTTHTSVKTPTAAARFLVDKIDIAKNDLGALAVKFEANIIKYFRQHKEDLLHKQHNIRRLNEMLTAQKKSEVEICFSNLKARAYKLIDDSKQGIKHIEDKIRLLNPKNVLKRGYSMTYKAGKVVKRISQVQVEEMIETLLYDGRIISRVKNISMD